MVEIEWPDGQRTAAPSWTALLETWRSWQWMYYTPEVFRAQLAWRAQQWSATHVDPSAPVERFFEELERARLLRIVPAVVTAAVSDGDAGV